MCYFENVHVQRFFRGEECTNLVVLHGWGSDSKEWEWMGALFTSFNLYLIDLPGFGKSFMPEVVWDVYRYAEFVKDVLISFGVKQCDVIGHSFGGRIVAVLSTKYPALVRKIILVAPAGIERKSLKVRVKIFLYKICVRPWNSVAPQKLQIHMGSANYRQAPGILRQILSKVTNQDLTKTLSSITQECLIMWGTYDSVLSPQYAEIYKKIIKKSSLVLIPGAGHFPHITHTRFVFPIMRDFLF